MANTRKRNIDFMGKRRYMLIFSIVMLTISIGAIAVRGLNFSIDFQGGTVVDIPSAGDVTIEQMRDAFSKEGANDPQIQTTGTEADRGFIVRLEETNPDLATAMADKVAADVGLPAEAVQNVTTIGPGWGKTVTNAAILALIASFGLITVYISIRFEYKMSISAILTIVHDAIITLGIYALLGQEVTPNTIAALLTILGFSLYDTVVVFHRINENSQHLNKQTFMDMANESVNEVFSRTINTGITALIPIIALLLFGGSTLKDFALALTIGQTVGMYSSIGVSTPIYALWKEREPKFAALKKRYGDS